MKRLFYFMAASCLLTACDKLTAETATIGTYSAIPDPFKVSVEEAYRMVANYAPRAGHVIRDGDSVPNTRAVWFSAERLKLLLEQIELDGGDGIRMYFAAYDDNYAAGTPWAPPTSFWGHNTLLLVPTRDSVAGGVTYHRDYFFADGRGLTMAMDTTLLSVPSEIENRGNVCPPLCDDDPTLLRPKPAP